MGGSVQRLAPKYCRPKHLSTNLSLDPVHPFAMVDLFVWVSHAEGMLV